jgi:hypothetical protein
MGIKKKKKSKNPNKSARDRYIHKHGMENLTAPLNDLQGEITEDIVHYLRSFPDAMRSPQIATEAMIKAVLPTDKIAMEPEFDDIFGDPISCVSIYVETISKMEVNWKSFGDLPPQLASSIRDQVLEETVRQFLTESLRLEILDGLNQFRLRKKRFGENTEAGIAAVLQLVLKDEKNQPIWPKIGLLHGIVHNSITLGLELKDSYNELLDENKDLLVLDNQKKYDILKEKFSNIDANPRLINFFNRQTKRIYDEGTDALFQGKLRFGFLTTEELNKVIEYMVKSIGFSDKEHLRHSNAFLSGLTEKNQKKFISGMGIFINETFTPERIEQMIQKLNSILKDPGDLISYVPFILMIRNALQIDDKLESRNIFLVSITLGEILAFQEDS